MSHEHQVPDRLRRPPAAQSAGAVPATAGLAARCAHFTRRSVLADRSARDEAFTVQNEIANFHEEAKPAATAVVPAMKHLALLLALVSAVSAEELEIDLTGEVPGSTVYPFSASFVLDTSSGVTSLLDGRNSHSKRIIRQMSACG